MHRFNWIFLLLTLALAACGGGGGGGGGATPGNASSTPQPSPPPPATGLERGGEPIGTYVYSPPPQAGDGWPTGDIADTGLDTELINEMMQRIVDEEFGAIHGILLASNGVLVLEEYFDGTFEGVSTQFDADTLHRINSATKSITSAAIGLAVDQGLIGSVDDPLIDEFFSDYNYLSPRAGGVTLEHALSMSSGLQWDEWTYPFDDARNDFYLLLRAADRVIHVLDRDQVSSPGTTFNYNTGLTSLLGEIILRVSGLPIDQYLDVHLFGALGIESVSWERYIPDNQAAPGYGLSMLPRDMAKFGQLYLDDGQWQGTQLITAGWVAQSTSVAVSVDGGRDYGYQWWLERYPVEGQQVHSYAALGYAGQRIEIFPELGLVLVMTGYNTVDPWDQTRRLLESYLLPASL